MRLLSAKRPYFRAIDITTSCRDPAWRRAAAHVVESEERASAKIRRIKRC